MKYILILLTLCFFVIPSSNAQEVINEIGEVLLVSLKDNNQDTLKSIFVSFDDILKSVEVDSLPPLTQVNLDTISARQKVHFAEFLTRFDTISNRGKEAKFNWEKSFVHHIDHKKTEEVSYRGNTKIITDFYQIDFYFSDGRIALAIYIKEAIGVGNKIKLVTVKDWVYGFL